MSDFNYQGEIGQSFSIEPRVLTSVFGDGYQQRVADGINNKFRSWSINFLREQADIDAIETFLNEKGGVTSFTWTPQNLSEVLVVCKKWDYNYLGGVARSLICTFEEVAE